MDLVVIKTYMITTSPVSRLFANISTDTLRAVKDHFKSRYAAAFLYGRSISRL